MGQAPSSGPFGGRGRTIDVDDELRHPAAGAPAAGGRMPHAADDRGTVAPAGGASGEDGPWQESGVGTGGRAADAGDGGADLRDLSRVGATGGISGCSTRSTTRRSSCTTAACRRRCMASTR